MAAYLIGQMRVTDADLWQQYVAGVARSLDGSGAHIVFRGETESILAGDQPFDRAVVIRFEDHDALLRWFRSPAYQGLIPLRGRAADMVLTSYRES